MALLFVVMPLESLLPETHTEAVSAELDAGARSAVGNGSQPAPVTPPERGMHVDHCVHAHLLVLTIDSPLPSWIPIPGGRVFDTSRQRPESVFSPPTLRPPIA